MFRTAFIAAFVAVASAASWPMITVNSAGDIVLNSPAKAGSFQLNAVTVTSAPTSSGTASRSTVTALDADTDAFIVNVPSSPATSAGYKLPTATEGRTIRFYNSGSGKGAFTIWTSSTSVFIDGTSSTTIDILSTTSYVTATATSSTNWVVSQNAVASGTINKEYRLAETLTLSSNAVTATAAQIAGGILSVAPTAASTLTTPTASSMTALDSNSANADSYEFSVKNTGTEVLATDITVTLTAGTGFTVPTDGTQLIVPGQTRHYIAYRTSSSAWTIIQKSQFVIYPTTALSGTAIGAAGAGGNTENSMRFTIAKTNSNAAQTFTISNAYAQIGDIIHVGGTAAVTGDAAAPVPCTVSAAGTISCFTYAAGADVQTLEFQIIKQ